MAITRYNYLLLTAIISGVTMFQIVDTKINEYIKSGIWNNEKSKMTDYPIGNIYNVIFHIYIL